MVHVPPSAGPVADGTPVAGAVHGLGPLDNRVVRGPRERPERASGGGVADGVVGRVGPRTAVQQVVPAGVLDHPRPFGDAAVAGLPVGLGLEDDLRLAGGFGGAGHRLDHDAEAGELDVIEVQPAVVVAEEVGVDGVVGERPPRGERAEGATGLGHADRLVGRPVEVEAAGGGVAPHVGGPGVPPAGLEDDRATGPADQVRRGVHAVPAAARDVAGGVQVVEVLVEEDGGVGQVAVRVDDGVGVGAGRPGRRVSGCRCG